MKLTYVPLLPRMRELYAMPRGMERFRAYLATMLAADGQDIDLPPLVLMNPMAKEHVGALLDTLLALDADGLAARALAEAAPALAEVEGDFKAALVVADDLKGGWTSRWANEYKLRFEQGPHLKRFWVSGVLWSSEPASEQAVRESILCAVHRAAYVVRRGPAVTVRDMLAQEGAVLAAAGCTGPVLDEDELAYTRAVVAPCLEERGMRAGIELLFGDDAARSLGMTPRGLGPLAGLALALYDARAGARLAH
jgi:hypothetical protein